MLQPRVSQVAGAGGAAAAAAEPARTGSRFSYSDVMEQPRHEPAPTLHTDFFVSEARTPRGGGVNQSPRFSSSGASSFNKVPAKGAPPPPSASDVAQKRFGNAKSISSDSFNRSDGADAETTARLARFAGAGAISSSDFYGRESSSPRGGGGGRRNSGDYGYDDDGLDISAAELVSKMKLQAQQDMAQLKDMASSAGRMLSGLANSVMAELQER